MSYKCYIEITDYPQNKKMDKVYDKRLKYIKPYAKGRGLDIGGINSFTKIMNRWLGSEIDNTEGDIDYGIVAPSQDYDFIICSHIIEHVMNPLVVMDGIYKHLADYGKVIIFYPTNIRQLKWNEHFHEIPTYDMKNLIEKAKFKIIKWDKERFRGSCFGIRPLIRKLFSVEHIIVLEKL